MFDIQMKHNVHSLRQVNKNIVDQLPGLTSITSLNWKEMHQLRPNRDFYVQNYLSWVSRNAVCTRHAGSLFLLPHPHVFDKKVKFTNSSSLISILNVCCCSVFSVTIIVYTLSKEASAHIGCSRNRKLKKLCKVMPYPPFAFMTSFSESVDARIFLKYWIFITNFRLCEALILQNAISHIYIYMYANRV